MERLADAGTYYDPVRPWTMRWRIKPPRTGLPESTGGSLPILDRVTERPF